MDRRPRRGIVNAKVAATTMFPSTNELFFTQSEEEKDVRNFLIMTEKRYPEPVPAPQNISKAECLEPWAIAGLQRALFKACARSYIPMGVAGGVAPARYGAPEEYPRTNPGQVLGYSKAVQEQCSLVFARCRRGDVNGLEDFCTSGNVPMATCDSDGFTPLIMGILSGNVEVIHEVLRICEKQHLKISKKKGKAPARIDNFELMAEMEDDEDDEDDKEDDEADDDDDDDEDEEEEEDDDEDAGEKKQKKMQTEMTKPGGSTMTSADLFCLTVAVHVESSPIMRQAEELREALVKKHGLEYVQSFSLATSTHVLVTPIQLAVLLGDIPTVGALLDEARKISTSLLRCVLTHSLPAAEKGSAWELAILLDRREMLQMMISSSAIGLPFERLAQDLNQTFKFRDLTTTTTTTVVSTEEGGKKKKKGGRAGMYTGLQSSLFGATKDRNEMKRDPRLARIDHLPNPSITFLHVAANSGALKCFQLFSSSPGYMELFQSLCKSLAQEEFQSVRELLNSARDRTPKAFAKQFGGVATLESDAEIILYYLLGGKDDTVSDGFNRMPIHHAVSGKMLTKFREGGVQFSRKCLEKSYTTVSRQDAIRFAALRETALGESTPGGSPLSVACVRNDVESIEELLKLGFNPNLPDAYFWGMNAFHLSLFKKQWKAARAVAAKMDPGRLLEKNSFGITPLMTAAKDGTVEGLLAAISCCPQAKQGQVVQIASDRDEEGHLALHFAANARFPEALKKIMDWTVEQSPTSWKCEEFSSGRTPFDSSIAVTITNEWSTAQSRNLAKEQLQIQSKRSAAGLEKEEDKFSESTTDGRQVVELLKRGATQARTRAVFQQVRPAREKRMEAVVGSVDAGDELKKEQEDMKVVWGEKVQQHPDALTAFLDGGGYEIPCDFLVTLPFSSNILGTLWA